MSLSALSILPPELLFGVICDLTDDPALARLRLSAVCRDFRAYFFFSYFQTARVVSPWRLVLHQETLVCRCSFLATFVLDRGALRVALLDVLSHQELFVSLNQGSPALSMHKAANILRAIRSLGDAEINSFLGCCMDTFLRKCSFFRANLPTLRVPAPRIRF